MELARQAAAETSTPFLVVVNTGFDFSLRENASTAGRYKGTNSRDRYRYTQSQRKFADQAVTTSSLSDLQAKVSFLKLFALQL